MIGTSNIRTATVQKYLHALQHIQLIIVILYFALVILPVLSSGLLALPWQERGNVVWGYGHFIRTFVLVPIIIVLVYIVSPLYGLCVSVLTYVHRKHLVSRAKAINMIIGILSVIMPLLSLPIVRAIIDWIDS